MSSGFLSRWSRLKRESETGQEPEGLPAAPVVPPPPPPAAAPASAPEVPPEGVEEGALLEGLTPESDFTRFMAREVSESLRRKAMKTLFSDPHFNVMDGLDIYIDDYTREDPLPPEMLAGLKHVGEWLKSPAEEGVRADSAEGVEARPQEDEAPALEQPEAPEPPSGAGHSDAGETK